MVNNHVHQLLSCFTEQVLVKGYKGSSTFLQDVRVGNHNPNRVVAVVVVVV